LKIISCQIYLLKMYPVNFALNNLKVLLRTLLKNLPITILTSVFNPKQI